MASLKHKIIKVKVEKIVFPGNVLCRCEDGIALFTEGLLPGEEAEVFVTRDKKTYREAKLENILTPSPLRIEPKCPSFGKCGGCSFEHTDYENQIKFKTDCVKELLNFTNIEIPQAKQSPVCWNYRNKMEFSFYNEKIGRLEDWKNGSKEEKLSLGLHCKGSFYKYSEVPPCYISHEDIIKACEIVKEFAINTGLKAYNNKSHEGFFRHLVLRKGVNTGDLLVNIVTNKQEDINKSFFDSAVKQLSSFCSSIYWTQNSKFSDAVNAESITLLYGNENITETLTIAEQKFNFSVAPFSFFQTNTKATEVLYNTVIELLQPDKQDTLLDMYCGTGAIGICLSPHVKSVVGVEQVEASIESAKHNAKINNINNIEFFAQPAQEWVKQNDKKFDSVIIDPPRAGLFENVIEHLLFLSPKKIVYVSCNPSTLARDLKLITKDNKYKVIKVCPVDMFPQTYHIETVVLLEKI
ncbi:MAG: 23S rRNA (uracil(1939)-C(5))-methyltransferase RlmD [Endomicrobiaceae bacterium]|nr:23S rRNA (uracil(1939)-C(5))-methyltransferase RlmD [Endomicrobiaceae bacterium]